MPEPKFKTVTVKKNFQNQRLDVYLSSFTDIPSRSYAAKLVNEKLVSVNERLEKVSYRVQEGDVVSISLPEAQTLNLTPYSLELEILYEDRDVIVINKPAGLVMHPSAGHEQKTLVNALLHHTQDLSVGFHELRPGIVHRLDKDTSGVVVVAKNNHAHNFLAEQFKNKSVHRIYYAIVFGYLKESPLTIRSQIARHSKDRKKFASTLENGQGKTAITHLVRLADYNEKISLLKCQLETGRTHQIRVHCSERGHPIVGDPIYGGKTSRVLAIKAQSIRQLIQSMDRIALHAKELGFVHPSTKKYIEFKTGWPDDIIQLVTELGFDSV